MVFLREAASAIKYHKDPIEGATNRYDELSQMFNELMSLVISKEQPPSRLLMGRTTSYSAHRGSDLTCRQTTSRTSRSQPETFRHSMAPRTSYQERRTTSISSVWRAAASLPVHPALCATSCIGGASVWAAPSHPTTRSRRSPTCRWAVQSWVWRVPPCLARAMAVMER